jgi:predicted small lipoprotein YifL
MSRIAAVLLTFSLAACGMKGPLELPPGPAPEPLLGTPKASKPATQASPSDVSTATKPNTQ